jgi:putative addiction module antidote
MAVKFKIKVVKIGNSLRITIPKEVAEAINLKAGDLVDISLENNCIIVHKIEQEQHKIKKIKKRKLN